MTISRSCSLPTIDSGHHQGALTANCTAYVALLRGVNVGGRNIMSMAALKQCLEQLGLINVRTFIQIGNVIFETGEKSGEKLTRRIERAVSAALGLDSRIALLSQAQLKTIVADAPVGWARSSDLRRNIAFLRPSVTASQALKQVEVKPGVDTVKAGRGVLYMSTVISGLQKSGLRKLIATPAYREMTIRTYGTCQKILALMREADTHDDQHFPSSLDHDGRVIPGAGRH